jgi:hypothetical protein
MFDKYSDGVGIGLNKLIKGVEQVRQIHETASRAAECADNKLSEVETFVHTEFDKLKKEKEKAINIANNNIDSLQNQIQYNTNLRDAKKQALDAIPDVQVCVPKLSLDPRDTIKQNCMSSREAAQTTLDTVDQVITNLQMQDKAFRSSMLKLNDELSKLIEKKDEYEWQLNQKIHETAKQEALQKMKDSDDTLKTMSAKLQIVKQQYDRLTGYLKLWRNSNQENQTNTVEAQKENIASVAVPCEQPPSVAVPGIASNDESTQDTPGTSVGSPLSPFGFQLINTAGDIPTLRFGSNIYQLDKKTRS